LQGVLARSHSLGGLYLCCWGLLRVLLRCSSTRVACAIGSIGCLCLLGLALLRLTLLCLALRCLAVLLGSCWVAPSSTRCRAVGCLGRGNVRTRLNRLGQP
jgi:hypothetical protein